MMTDAEVDAYMQTEEFTTYVQTLAPEHQDTELLRRGVKYFANLTPRDLVNAVAAKRVSCYDPSPARDRLQAAIVECFFTWLDSKEEATDEVH